MKKVAVVLNTLNFGGVAKSFIEFVKLIKNDCDLDVILFREDGDLMEHLPKDVNVIIPKGYMGTFVADRKSCKKLGKKQFLFKFFMDACCKFTHNRKPFIRFATRHSQKFSGYDVAISYTKVCPKFDPWGGCAEYVLTNIGANKKYVVNHDTYFDFNFDKGIDKTIQKFDKMFVVSKSCLDITVNNRPELKDKLDYIYNPIDTDEIIKKANEPLSYAFDRDKLQLVSVGRLDEQKRYLELIKIIDRVKKSTTRDFVLNIVGDGILREEVENEIKRLDLAENVKLWGFQKNPYNIIKNCDLFVLNSRWESFGIVYIEAMTLSVPVITSNVEPAQEIVGSYGFIAENDDKFVELLKNIIDNETELNKLKQGVFDYRFDNREIKNKWLAYITKE